MKKLLSLLLATVAMTSLRAQIVDVVVYDDCSKNGYSIGIENGYTWVDLGLSVKWATCNVGATKPEEYGDYFAWGETETYYLDTTVIPIVWKANKGNGYDLSSHRYCNGNCQNLTKYYVSSPFASNENGFVDNLKLLELTDDAANYNMGGHWRMPTHAEQEELFNNCDFVWTDNYNNTNIAGCIVNSKKSGFTDRHIFLPATGFRDGIGISNTSIWGVYWSSSIDEYIPCRGQLLYFGSTFTLLDQWGNRGFGFTVRAVCP